MYSAAQQVPTHTHMAPTPPGSAGRPGSGGEPFLPPVVPPLHNFPSTSAPGGGAAAAGRPGSAASGGAPRPGSGSGSAHRVSNTGSVHFEASASAQGYQIPDAERRSLAVSFRSPSADGGQPLPTASSTQPQQRGATPPAHASSRLRRSSAGSALSVEGSRVVPPEREYHPPDVPTTVSDEAERLQNATPRMAGLVRTPHPTSSNQPTPRAMNVVGLGPQQQQQPSPSLRPGAASLTPQTTVVMVAVGSPSSSPTPGLLPATASGQFVPWWASMSPQQQQRQQQQTRSMAAPTIGPSGLSIGRPSDPGHAAAAPGTSSPVRLSAGGSRASLGGASSLRQSLQQQQRSTPPPGAAALQGAMLVSPVLNMPPSPGSKVVQLRGAPGSPLQRPGLRRVGSSSSIHEVAVPTALSAAGASDDDEGAGQRDTQQQQDARSSLASAASAASERTKPGSATATAGGGLAAGATVAGTAVYGLRRGTATQKSLDLGLPGVPGGSPGRSAAAGGGAAVAPGGRPPRVGFLRRRYVPDVAYKPQPRKAALSAGLGDVAAAGCLDSELLLREADEADPSCVHYATLRSKGISSVDARSLAPFAAQLAQLDLTDNALPSLAALLPLESLRQLSLTANSLTCLGDLPHGAFARLEVLHLGFNRLPVDVALGPDSPLALLPRLQELDLSGSSYASLPPQLGAFVHLHSLNLGRNRLAGDCLLPLGQLPALQHLTLSQNRVVEVPAAVGGGGSGLFAALESLDLANNRIAAVEALQPLTALRQLRSVVLAGNPLVVAARVAAARAAALAATGLPPAATLVDAANAAAVMPHGDQLSYSALGFDVVTDHPLDSAAALHVPRLGELLARDGQFLSPADMSAGGSAAKSREALAAIHAAILATPHEALVELFSKVDAAIDDYRLNAVPEEEAEEAEDEEEEDEELQDNTFLTGVGITEEEAPGREEEDQQQPQGGEQAPPPKPRPAWADVEDPTERMALALGLDPARLAIHDGHLTTDAYSTIRALKYALSHPLVGLSEGLAPPQHHLAMTASVRAKQVDRRKYEPLGPGDGGDDLAGTMTSAAGGPKAARIQTMESMLTDMKDKLAELEGKLERQLAELASQAPTAPTAPAVAGMKSLVVSEQAAGARNALEADRSKNLLSYLKESKERRSSSNDGGEDDDDDDDDDGSSSSTGSSDADGAGAGMQGDAESVLSSLDGDVKDALMGGEGDPEEERSVDLEEMAERLGTEGWSPRTTRDDSPPRAGGFDPRRAAAALGYG